MAGSVPNGSGNWLGSLAKGVKSANAAKDAVPSQERVEAVVEPVKPVVAPAASTVEKVVPTAEIKPEVKETPVVVPEVAKEQPISDKPKQRVVKIDDEDTLVEIPGMQAKSIKNLKFELSLSKDQTRKEADLRFREEQLQKQRDEFYRERERKVEPVAEIRAPVVEDVAPTPPKDAVPGDPEHDAYLIELGAYKATQRMKPQLDRIVDDLDERRASDAAVKQTEVQAKTNVETNQRLYTESLASLDFDIDSLSETAQQAVVERISAVAMDVGVDLRNGAHLRSLSPSEMRLIFRAAYPPGSRPPGYTEEVVVEETPEMKMLRENDGKPLVEKEKPEPLHIPGTGGIAARKQAAPIAGGGWEQRLSGKFKELAGT